MSNKPPKSLTIRNSTAEFLIFTNQAGEDGIEVRYQDETIWLTQKLMAELFDTTKSTISEHLRNIYTSKELNKSSTVRNFRTVRKEGNRNVERELEFYNLDAIISVEYRVNSKRATQFRQWATRILREFAVKGYVLDKKRLEQGVFLGEDYFERLLAEIREIRQQREKHGADQLGREPRRKNSENRCGSRQELSVQRRDGIVGAYRRGLS